MARIMSVLVFINVVIKTNTDYSKILHRKPFLINWNYLNLDIITVGEIKYRVGTNELIYFLDMM